MKNLNLKTICLTTISLFMASTTIASEATDKAFEDLLKKEKISPIDQQAYCYSNEKNEKMGVNLDLKIRLASVSKLLTSLWAIEKLGINYKYETKLFIKGNHLHIKGSFDPFLSNEKMLYLVSELNRLGYKSFDKITYDKRLLINPNAQFHTDQYPLITRDSNARNLKLYFNTENWSKIFRSEYTRIQKLAKKDIFLPEVNFSVNEVVFSEENPFGEITESTEDIRVLTLSSPELFKYLKETNVKSNNYSSHTIFRDLGGEKEFEQFLQSRFSLTSEAIKLYNGSGLPSSIEGKRYDNYATCSIMLDLIQELKESAERQGKGIQDIVAVPGNDQGTFRNRLNSSDYKNTFVAKTGTLMHTSTLAGAMSTKSGISFFGIFNQTTNIVSAKRVQNQMINVLMDDLGGPENFKYVVDGFHTYDKNDVIKSFEEFEFENEESDFMPFEQGLF